jgi:hypothetical protein
LDKIAKAILFKTYWTSAGWNDKYITEPKDFEYAKSMGLMFDPLTISKPELIYRLGEILKSISLETISDAFLCSLTNKRLDWRSGLGSYANAKRLLTDQKVDDHYYGYGKNEDINILNFERIKWGGVRHDYGLYNLLDLELLNKESIPKPSDEDILKFQKILDTIVNSLPNDTPSKLRDNLSFAIKASKDERHTLMEILGCAEIILPSRIDRKEPGRHDWTFVLHWRGEDRYNKQNVSYYFGDYGIE